MFQFITFYGTIVRHVQQSRTFCSNWTPYELTHGPDTYVDACVMTSVINSAPDLARIGDSVKIQTKCK